MNKLEVNYETKRPFRLWNPKTNKFLSHRCFKYDDRAHIGALIEARWAKIGTVVEVLDVSQGKLLGVYMRRANDVYFENIKRLRQPKGE